MAFDLLTVAFLECQNSWAPGLLTRIEWDYPQFPDTHAPYLTLTPKEYFRRNCWARATLPRRSSSAAPGSTVSPKPISTKPTGRRASA